MSITFKESSTPCQPVVWISSCGRYKIVPYDIPESPRNKKLKVDISYSSYFTGENATHYLMSKGMHVNYATPFYLTLESAIEECITHSNSNELKFK